MKMIFVLIILAVILLSVAIAVFFWAVKKRQFDDLEVHAYNILKEDNFETSIENPVDTSLKETRNAQGNKQ